MIKQAKQTATCTWAMNNFPRALKNKYSAYCKANGVRVADHTEYLISKVLREAEVNIPPLSKDNTFARKTS